MKTEKRNDKKSSGSFFYLISQDFQDFLVQISPGLMTTSPDLYLYLIIYHFASLHACSMVLPAIYLNCCLLVTVISN